MWTQQNSDTSLPLQKPTGGFFTPWLFFRFCAQLCSHHTLSLHTIQPNFTAQKTHKKLLEKSYSLLFYCGNLQSISDLKHFTGNLFHCCFSGLKKCCYQGCWKSTFLFCKICTLYWYLQCKSIINHSTMTNYFFSINLMWLRDNTQFGLNYNTNQHPFVLVVNLSNRLQKSTRK